MADHGLVWAGSSSGAGLRGKPNPPGAGLSQNARFRAEGWFIQGPVLKQGPVHCKTHAFYKMDGTKHSKILAFYKMDGTEHCKTRAFYKTDGTEHCKTRAFYNTDCTEHRKTHAFL